jgi:tetratricopeptide (TPR) repeat protein
MLAPVLAALVALAVAPAAAGEADSDPHFQLGMQFYNQLKYPEAVKELTAAIKSYPADAFLNVKLCHALERASDFERAKSRCRIALELWPKSAEAHGTLGNALIKTGVVLEGVAEYRLCLKYDPAAELRSNLGLILDKLRKFDEAAEECRRAAGYHPDDDLAYRCLGIALLNQRKVDDAVAALRRAAKLNPKSRPIQGDLADALSAQGSDEEALGLYRAAAKGGWFAAHLGLGKLLAKKGNRAEAAAELSTYLKMSANYGYIEKERADAARLLDQLNGKTAP